jgi:hypothetical protein
LNEEDENMGDRLLRKELVLGIIFLFIGAGVYPAIAVKLNTSINTVQDEKSNVDAKKIEQLSDLPCNCKKNNKTDGYPERLCEFLFFVAYFFWMSHIPPPIFIYYLMKLFNCPIP